MEAIVSLLFRVDFPLLRIRLNWYSPFQISLGLSKFSLGGILQKCVSHFDRYWQIDDEHLSFSVGNIRVCKSVLRVL